MRRGRRKSSGAPTSSPVRVAVRIRPPAPRQHERGDDDGGDPDESAPAFEHPSTLLPQCVSPSSSSSTSGGCNTLQFHYENQTKTFTHELTARPIHSCLFIDVYTTALQPLLTPFLNGFNVTVLAYGQTGSGKTYTVGNKTNSTPVASPVRPDEPSGGGGGGGREPKAHRIGDEDGLLPRFLCDLFAALRKEPSVKTIHVSFLEIYCDEVRDLLQQQTRGQHQGRDNQLAIREDEHKVWVENLRQLQVENVQKALELMNLGRSRQVVAHNAINDTSSRSHAIYTMEVARKFVNEIKKTKLTFVDLAGSERLKKTQVEGVRMKESIQINVGLLALGNVINALGDDKSQKRRNSIDGSEAAASAPFVPYRSSKLTRLLRDSLGGNSMTLFIACVSPSEVHGSETLNTLQYANRARNIQNKAEKNVESLDSGGSSPRTLSSPRNGKRLQRTASELEIHSLQEQICFLKQQLDQANAAAAAATIVGTNIPSLLQVQIPPLHTKKNNDVRATERVTPMKESDADDPLEVSLPVIPITTKASKIKPPSHSKLSLPLSPKTTARSLTPPVDRVANGEDAPESTINMEKRQASYSGVPSSSGIVTNGAPAAENYADAVKIQIDCPVAPAAVANLVTAIELACNPPLVVQDDELTEFDVGGSSSVELHVELLPETGGESRKPVMTGEKCLRVQESNHVDCLRSTEQHDQECSIACEPPPESSAQSSCSPDETTTFPEVPSENRQQPSESAVGDDRWSAESPTGTESPKSIESLQVEYSTLRGLQGSETEVVPVSDSEATSSEDSASDRNCYEPAVQILQRLVEVKVQEDAPQSALSLEATRNYAPMAPKEGFQEMPARDDKQTNDTHANSFVVNECQNQTDADEIAAQGSSDPAIWASELSDIDDETAFSLVGPVPESESSDDELGLSACISPEYSPVTSSTQSYLIARNAVKISSNEPENWKLVNSGVPVPRDEAGNQDLLDEATTFKDNHEPFEESEPQSQVTDSGVETVSEPDFVLRRPPLCQTLLSPRTHRRGRLSPQKLPLRPMSIFDFDDSWDKLQRSRPPSSVSRLESLVKSIKQLITDEFGESSNQGETKGDNAETHRASPTSAADRCLQAMTSYFARQKASQQRIGKLKRKLLEFETVLGFPGSIYDERQLCVFVASHQEVFLQQRIDFCEAIAAQRVLRRLRSRQEANKELSNLNPSSIEDTFLSDDQFSACEEWLQSKLFDRAYFHRHVLPLVLNEWIAVTPADLERENAWLAL